MHFQDFNLQNALAGLKKITDGAKAITGPLAALGVPYAKLVNAGLEVAQGLEQHISDGAIVATSTDRQQVVQIITDLQAANDKLAEQIDAS